MKRIQYKTNFLKVLQFQIIENVEQKIPRSYLMSVKHSFQLFFLSLTTTHKFEFFFKISEIKKMRNMHDVKIIQSIFGLYLI